MDTYVVGDIHGRREIVDFFVDMAKQNEVRVVFVGDFMDSFYRSPEDQVLSIMSALDGIENARGHVQAIVANHEMSYLDFMQRCGGWNTRSQGLFDQIKSSVTRLFEPYVWVDDYLVTHAGLSQMFLNAEGMTIQGVLDDPRCWDVVGRTRGGTRPCGGIRWCDYNHEFEPVPHLKQIFGHTVSEDIRREGDNWMIDCLEFKAKCLYIPDGGEPVEFDFTDMVQYHP